MNRVKALVWGSWLALAAAAPGCWVILGNDKDYVEIDGGTGVGGAASSSASTGSSVSGMGGNAATCQDGVQNGAETDVDCGGGPCPVCAVGQKCIANSDCISSGCDITTKTCDADQCHDGIKNSTETDVDCGGSCPPCADGKACLAASDCAGGGCCGSACVNLATDAKNCGSCGRDCLGSTCSAKLCDPVTLASGESAPSAIAVDATNVYWINATAGVGLAKKCAVSGCGGNPTAIGSSSNGNGIATDGTNVYWTKAGTSANSYMDGSVVKCAVSGCGGVPTVLASAQYYPYGIAVDKATVYWTNNAPGTVMKCAIAGCNNTPTTLASGQSAPFGISVGATSVYWANRNDGTVKRCLVGGCGGTATLVVTSQDPTAIAVNAQYAYFVNESGVNLSGGTVVRVALLGGPPVTLASAGLGNSIEDIAIDGTSVYWTTCDGVFKCALGGCGGAPTTLAVGQGCPHGIAVDATSVYWTTGNTVAKTVK